MQFGEHVNASTSYRLEQRVNGMRIMCGAMLNLLLTIRYVSMRMMRKKHNTTRLWQESRRGWGKWPSGHYLRVICCR